MKELIQTIQVASGNLLGDGLQKVKGVDVPDIHTLFRGLSEELDRLDTRDFDPAARYEFVVLRLAIRKWGLGQIGNSKKAAEGADRMSVLLDSYGGTGSGAISRDFAFVTNPDVKSIVERDYRELAQKAFPDGSWKSAVILSGSILEAVLHDVLTKDGAAIAATMNSARAPKKKGGATRDITKQDRSNQWTLHDFICVADDLQVLPANHEKAIHQVLRSYRNLVHPAVELAMGISISEGHATASKGMLDVTLDHLS
tara:strand:- start:6981 stop:7748 length:768 start_codon:yes stop_codon:yes gene_type:complete